MRSCLGDIEHLIWWQADSRRWPYCSNVKLKCQPPVFSQLIRLIKLNYCWLQLFLPLLFSTQVSFLKNLRFPSTSGSLPVRILGRMTGRPWIQLNFSWWEPNVWYLWKSTKSSGLNATPCPYPGKETPNARWFWANFQTYVRFCTQICFRVFVWVFVRVEHRLNPKLGHRLGLQTRPLSPNSRLDLWIRTSSTRHKWWFTEFTYVIHIHM